MLTSLTIKSPLTVLTPSWKGVMDPSGSIIPNTTNDDFGAGGSTDSRLISFPLAVGPFISAKGYGQSIGNYKVILTEKEIIKDDHDGNTSTKSAVSVDENVSGNIDFVGDGDWFSVNLESGTNMVFLLKEGNLNPELKGIHSLNIASRHSR